MLKAAFRPTQTFVVPGRVWCMCGGGRMDQEVQIHHVPILRHPLVKFSLAVWSKYPVTLRRRHELRVRAVPFFPPTMRIIQTRFHFESRLNKLVRRVDTRFAEQDGQINETNAKLPAMMKQMQAALASQKTQSTMMEEIRTGFPQRLQQIIGERRSFVTERTISLTEVVQQLTDGLRQCERHSVPGKDKES